MPSLPSSSWTMTRTIRTFSISMCRVSGRIERRTARQAISLRAIHSSVGSLTRWRLWLVEVSVIRLINYSLYLTVFSSGTQSSMRTSKSMPDSNMRKFSKWGSINTDSGISLFSSDTMTIKHKDAMSISSSSSSSTTKPQRTQMLPPEAVPAAAQSKMVQQLEDARRFVSQHFQFDLSDLFYLPQVEALHAAASTATKERRTTAFAREKPLATYSSRHRNRANNDRRMFVLRRGRAISN